MTLLVVRVLLAAVFVSSGIAKLSDREGVRGMVVEFGFPARLASPLAWVLACGELGVAAALVFRPSAQVGGLAALVLLLAFGAVVAIAVSHGRRPECHCFGRLGAGEVGWSTVARNALLASGAGFVVADGRFAFVFAALALAAVGVWLGLRSRGARRLRPGASAPELSLIDLAGQTRTLDGLIGDGSPLLLVFSDPGCGACQELMPELARWQDRSDAGMTVAVVTSGSPDEQLRVAREHRLRTLLRDVHRSAAVAYGVSATPSAVLIDTRGRIAAAPAAGAGEIIELMERTIAGRADATLARRAVLARATVGIAGITVGPLLESATAAARGVKRVVRPKTLKVDGAWLCDQRYALCTSARCKPSKTDPKVSVCTCKVKTGYSVGFKSCEERAAKGGQLHSNYSLQDVTGRTRALKCSEKALWVQCLDFVCELDRHDPSRAFCQCANMRTKNFFTFGGDCRTETCSSVIWSATTAPFPGGAQYEKGLKRLGIPYRVPKSCPSVRR